MRLGALQNPASTLNRRGPPLYVAPGTPVVVPEGADATQDALAGLLAGGAEVIVIDGGDGTVRAALDALARLGALETVALALLPRGNTNLFCREIGGWPVGAGATMPERAVMGAGATVVRRRLLRVRTGDDARLGLIFGLGAYERATRLVAEGGAEGGVRRGAVGVAAAVAGALWRAFMGGREGPWRRGVALEVGHDGGAGRAGRRLLFVATTARGGLLPGINPFWQDAGAAGPVRWLDVAAPGRHLAVAVPFALAGRPRRWMTRSGYASGRSARIEIRGADAYVIDGDVFETRPGCVLALDAEVEARFVVPLPRRGGDPSPAP